MTAYLLRSDSELALARNAHVGSSVMLLEDWMRLLPANSRQNPPLDGRRGDTRHFAPYHRMRRKVIIEYLYRRKHSTKLFRRLEAASMLFTADSISLTDVGMLFHLPVLIFHRHPSQIYCHLFDYTPSLL